MPLYAYKGLSETGARVAGEAVAESEDELLREFDARGFLLQHISPKRSRRFGFGGARRIRDEDRMLFAHQFTVLLRAGLTIPEALQIATEGPEHQGLGKVLQRVLNDVKGGDAISLACSRYPDAFDQLFIAAVTTSEKTGNIVHALQRYQAYLKNRIRLGNQVRQAMVYPVFLLVTLGAVLSLLFIFVLPKFVTMYADFGAALPQPTRILIHIVDSLPAYLTAAGLLLAGFWAAYRLMLRTRNGRLWIDRLKLAVPYYGSFYRLFSISQLARTLSALLSSGTPLMQSIDTCAKVITCVSDEPKLRAAGESVEQGEGLSAAFSKSDLLTPMALKMIQVGETSGDLGEMLDEVADYYDEELEGGIGRMIALIEPLLMLLMGALLGVVIIVMYLPIFSIADVIG